MQLELNERVAALEADRKTLFHKIEAVDKKIETIHELAKSVALLAKSMQDVDEKVDGIGNRLDIIERTPAENAKHYNRTVITALITGAISFVVGTLGAVLFGGGIG